MKKKVCHDLLYLNFLTCSLFKMARLCFLLITVVPNCCPLAFTSFLCECLPVVVIIGLTSRLLKAEK